jgi:oligopeptide/dipeptide ABC transporter ATP-binding protein
MLEIDDLHVTFPGPGGRPVAVVRGVSLSVDRGETLGVVGESGSGKSVTALAALRLIAPPGRIASGEIRLDGENLLVKREREMRAVRGGRIAMVFQDPLTSLNPTLTVGEQLVETILAHRSMSRDEAWKEAAGWLDRVRIPLAKTRLRQYPTELSGGMRQRVVIAMAFCCHPEVLLADEPTTALDVTVQAQILDLMDDLKQELGSAVVLITHDLAIVAERCDRVAVMYAGQIVENAPAAELFRSPRHPYTRALLASASDMLLPRTDAPLPGLPGQPPDPSRIPPGCPFAPRCPEAIDACRAAVPLSVAVASDHAVRCIRHDDPAGALSAASV